MPSSSAKQHRFMQAVAHNPSFAKKAGVSQSVGKDFSAADKGRTFNKGGMMKKGKRFNGEDGESEVEYHDYDPDKTYSGRSHDDETGGLAENTPTRAYKPEKRETEDTPAPVARARAAAPAASAPDAAPAPAASAPAAPSAARNKAQKPEPISNAEKLAVAGTSAVAAGLIAAGVARLAGRKAGIIEKVIGKFTSKGSKTPEPQVFRSNRPSVVAAERSKARGGRIVRMASGGSVSAASSRADGIAQRGKTKFRIY